MTLIWFAKLPWNNRWLQLPSGYVLPVDVFEPPVPFDVLRPTLSGSHPLGPVLEGTQMFTNGKMHKRERPSQRVSLAIATLVSSVTTTKGQGFYVELFWYLTSLWSRSPRRRGILYQGFCKAIFYIVSCHAIWHHWVQKNQFHCICNAKNDERSVEIPRAVKSSSFLPIALDSIFSHARQQILSPQNISIKLTCVFMWLNGN